MAVLYAGARLLDLSYAPFALTDWIARVAPGDLLTSSIDGMVSWQLTGVTRTSA